MRSYITIGNLGRLIIWGLTIFIFLFAAVLFIVPFSASLPENQILWVALFFTLVAFVMAPLSGLGVMRYQLLSGSSRILVFISVFCVLGLVTLMYFYWGEASSDFYAGLTVEIYGALLTAGLLIYITSYFENRTTTLDEETIDLIATKVAEKLRSGE